MSTAKVFVGSLPPGCKPEELRHLFTSYGVVVECDIMNRCGFVHLETVEMAEAAIAALNGIEFKGQAIVVEPGRPKDRRGGGGGGGAVGGGGSDGGRAANRRPMQGGSFNRGGHMSGNSFRGGAGGGRGNNRTSNSNDSHFGPMRNEGSFRQQRNAPYSKQNQSTDAPPQQAFNKNKFNQSGGYNDFHNGSHGGHRGGGFEAAKNIGQDRRGFALPAVDHHHQQQQQQMSFGSANKQGRFGNGPLPSGNSADNGMFQRQRNNLGMNSGSTQPGRGSFSANRGGFAGRGGFNARRGGSGQNSSQSGNFNKHGPTNGHHHQQHNNAPNSYQSDFPPLGSQGGSVPGRNRFNGPP
ncbi:keratin, type I cytoskeletal 9 [Drosophila sulfurigaster albostrigata]|uniref:keratin, type I cytoskeletal 9 n=1 Tax=Drosophila sulfurigaster albostrigata TaxID=89887 RepID=UPI002D21AEAA|nr:keratin, type I cytoskeletal 9 [Drosophila sulfurigaster albostrigata]